MVIHLAANASIVNGVESFQNIVYQIHSLGKALVVVEWLWREKGMGWWWVAVWLLWVRGGGGGGGRGGGSGGGGGRWSWLWVRVGRQ